MVLCTLAKYDSSIPLQKKKKSAQTIYFCHYSKHCLPFKLENMLTFTVFLMIFFVRFLLWWTSLSSSLNILTFNQATWNRPWVTLQHSQCHRWGNNNCLLFLIIKIVSTFFVYQKTAWVPANDITQTIFWIFFLCVWFI